MSLFPRLHYGESMIDFEKLTYFHREVIFHTVGSSQGLEIVVFDVKSVDAGGHKNRKSSEKFKIMLESCKETSKLSVDSFMDPYDRIVPQK